ncbi:glycosyltransferase family 2 protein [Tahibacter amnicola]|uniref:Glycosyltransferase family 2 protein n=1 Tax=Tahibacter amnicola TaxID=2976241 RepID=A0ABY6BE41_9GAMM|nr:glycosyltransferase family 2 protein [Tahibacter amnicola]UXI67513.1 glycosyltransferase family 2 protein [Tahibacter amnicola]
MPETPDAPEYSLIIPVYRNEESLPDLLVELAQLAQGLDRPLEVVFVVDGSPDRSHAHLAERLPAAPFASQLILLSRNFGSFAAIREGLSHARGKYFAVMAADLQEPPQLVREFFRLLASDAADVTLGTRTGRDDPFIDRIASRLFWSTYRRLVQPELPAGGVDMFGCNQAFRDQLLRFEESNSSLVGQVIWLGFRRAEVPYHRVARRHGKSAWTFSRKLHYLMNSVFSFTDLPIRLLTLAGLGGIVICAAFGLLVAVLRLSGWVAVPGYSATILTILFFGALNLLGFGIVGSYVWRAYENTKRRPQAVVFHHKNFSGKSDV